MVIVAEIIPKMVIITAGWAFTYLIKVSREEHHELITHGVHRFASHPSYCGFHIPSVGTQTMLCNPMSTIGPAIVVCHSFADMITHGRVFLETVFWITI